MDTAHIKEMIAARFADPVAALDLHELLVVVAEREGASPTDAELAAGASFVYHYIKQVPYLLTVAWTSATTVGLHKEIESILNMVESYWIEDNDVIPDSLGIIGLLDDAYCSLLSMQTISDFYQFQTGKFLFPDDLTAANDIMRKIIGEPYATELDNIVRKAVHEARVKEAVKGLASPEKQALFESQATIWNHEPVKKLSVDRLSGLGLTKSLTG